MFWKNLSSAVRFCIAISFTPATPHTLFFKRKSVLRHLPAFVLGYPLRPSYQTPSSSSCSLRIFPVSLPLMLTFTLPSMTTSSRSSPSSPSPRVLVKPITTRQDLLSALQLRRCVFVDEMNIPSNCEYDQYDRFPIPSGIIHFLVSHDSDAIATCRVNVSTSNGAKLERMAVAKCARRKGVGGALLKHVEECELVKQTKGPLYCSAMKDKQLFYANAGWTVEEGHGNMIEVGLPHVLMLKRRRPKGAPAFQEMESLGHVMIRTWDIARARRFYSLLGFQDVCRFLTNGLRAVWIEVSHPSPNPMFTIVLLPPLLTPIRFPRPTHSRRSLTSG